MRRLISVLILVTAVCACKKNGTGGSTDVTAFVAHHGKPIRGATLYVKFKAKDAPSDPTTRFDLKEEGNPKEDHIHVHDLLPGDYYLFAVGYDSSIAQVVRGGLPVVISRKDKNSELDVHVAVTE